VMGKTFDRIISVASKCLVACLAAVVIAPFFFTLAIVFIQWRKDEHAEKVAKALQGRISAHRPVLGAGLKFPPHAGGLVFWASHQPKAAPVWDQIWNSRYPCVGGTVTTQGEMDQVKEIVRVVCAKHRFDPQMVAFFVRLERKK
jgi:hypothetical protein